MHRPVFALLALVIGCGSTPAPPTRDPGPPDARWRIIASRTSGPVAEDPGALACAEPERYSWERGERQTGWADRCGWRRHTTCVEHCPLIMAGCSIDCNETTPRVVALQNAVMHVQRLFASVEGCVEDAVTPTLLREEDRDPVIYPQRVGPTHWRAIGCDKRGRFTCRPSPDEPSGFACRRLDFSDEAQAEVLDEARALFAKRVGGRAECAEPELVGRQVATVKLPSGEPGLTLALRACGEEVIYACMRPDLVPPDRAACREAPADPAFVEAARDKAAALIEKTFACKLGPGDAPVVATDELAPDHRSVRFAATACNATRDVRGVQCSSVSLVDAAVRGCWLDSLEAETRESRERAAELAGTRDPSCGPGRNEATVVDSRGAGHLVLVRCFGARREGGFYRCRRDFARDDAVCEPDAASQSAGDALERAARERFEREERCPDGKTTSEPVEGRVGDWALRVDGCGANRSYFCADLAGPISACPTERPRDRPKPSPHVPMEPDAF